MKFRNKIFIRVVCLLLSLAVLSAPLTLTASAASSPDAAAADDSAEAVAKMSLFIRISTDNYFGHMWVYFENISDHELTVGLYTLEPGEGVSVGWFFVTRSDGFGVYYNIESYSAEVFDASGRLSITDAEITEAELARASKAILSGNYWSPLHNCASFALSVWNSAASPFVLPIPVPWLEYLFILVLGGTQNQPMYYAGADRVYKQRGLSSGAYLSGVSDATLDHPI